MLQEDTELTYPMERRCPFDPPQEYADLQKTMRFAPVRLWDGLRPYLVTTSKTSRH